MGGEGRGDEPLEARFLMNGISRTDDSILAVVLELLFCVEVESTCEANFAGMDNEVVDDRPKKLL
jgi:hypothetical protein